MFFFLLQLLVEMLIKLHKQYVVPRCLVIIITMNLLLYFLKHYTPVRLQIVESFKF